MPKRNRLRLPYLLAATFALLPLAAAPPARAQLTYNYDFNELYAGRPGSVLVHGRLDGYRVLAVEEPKIFQVPGHPGRVELELSTAEDPGAIHLFAHRVAIADPQKDFVLLVEGVDAASGVRRELLRRMPTVQPNLSIEVSRKTLGDDETFTVRARFRGASGRFNGWSVEGDRIRLLLTAGCYYCMIPFPTTDYDLVSPPIGPLPGGVYTLDVEDYGGLRDTPFQRETIVVVPQAATLRDGRFAVEIRLDPPHGSLARPAFVPSRDSALFYFFDADNWEAMVKVLDGCALNGRYWVFAAASTDVGYTLAVRDLASGEERQYRHEAGQPAPAVTDIEAFSCAAGAGAAS